MTFARRSHPGHMTRLFMRGGWNQVGYSPAKRGSLSELKAREKVRILIEAGIDSFVDLTEAGEMSYPDETQRAAGRGGGEGRAAGTDSPPSSPASATTTSSWTTRVTTRLSNTFVVSWTPGSACTSIPLGRQRTHRHRNRVRWLIDTNELDYKSTVQRMCDLRQGTRKLTASPMIPSTSAQHDVLRRRASRRQQERSHTGRIG